MTTHNGTVIIGAVGKTFLSVWLAIWWHCVLAAR
jgi:hypothetical protein